VSERLQKFLSGAGIASRRKAEALILAGEVTVNGQRAELGQKVAPGDVVRVHGRRVEPKAQGVTYALYKPAGVLSAVSDDRGRKTVMDLAPRVPGLHPVGRLDYTSEGLLLLTTDGELTLRLTHPRYAHEKEYRVWCDRPLTEEAVRRFVRGVTLEDGPARALRATLSPGGCTLVLTEGRNRQVRRMLAALGFGVTRLLRTRVGGLTLGGLKPGEVRRLSEGDLAKLGYTRDRAQSLQKPGRRDDL